MHTLSAAWYCHGARFSMPGTATVWRVRDGATLALSLLLFFLPAQRARSSEKEMEMHLPLESSASDTDKCAVSHPSFFSLLCAAAFLLMGLNNLDSSGGRT
eukprot:698771-Rhodomonas_salina.1